MLERKPTSFAWLALIPLFTFVCLLCGLFGLLGTLTGFLSDPYAAIRTSMAENNLLTPITAGPTTTPGPESTYPSSAEPGIFSTAGKLSSQTVPLTLTVNGPFNQIETSTITATFTVSPSLTATPLRAITATPSSTQTPTPDQSSTATIATIGDCNCEEYPEGDPRNLDCTTTSFKSIEEAQACLNYCMATMRTDVYHLDSKGNGIACEEGLSTPTATP